jgi:hypothetical protein
MEAYLGFQKTILIYILGGACGALFGDVTQCCGVEQYYGEVTAGLYALYGGYLAVNNIRILLDADHPMAKTGCSWAN